MTNYTFPIDSDSSYQAFGDWLHGLGAISLSYSHLWDSSPSTEEARIPTPILQLQRDSVACVGSPQGQALSIGLCGFKVLATFYSNIH